jgi:PD-(D/E)XK nuclease superfamily
MPEKLLKTNLPAPFTFSQSSLQDYTDCNRRFQLRYIEQLQWPAVETAPVLENERRQIEGQQFHRMVHQYLLGLPAEKLSFIANHSKSDNLARWWDNFLGAQKTSLAGLEGQKFFPEQTLTVPLGNHRITAKYDMIAIKDDHATIYDWKTYHKRPRDEWMAARLQTRVYLSMLVKAGAYLHNGQPFSMEKIEMVYWYADFPTEPAKFTYDDIRFERDWMGLNVMMSEISSRQSYPLTDDEKICGFCPYRSYCERGVNAGEGEETETDMDPNWEVNLEQIQEIEF